MIGLEKEDWNKKEGTLHIKRNAQSVKNRDESGSREKGYRIVFNTTKTYSGVEHSLEQERFCSVREAL